VPDPVPMQPVRINPLSRSGDVKHASTAECETGTLWHHLDHPEPTGNRRGSKRRHGLTVLELRPMAPPFQAE